MDTGARVRYIGLGELRVNLVEHQHAVQRACGAYLDIRGVRWSRRALAQSHHDADFAVWVVVELDEPPPVIADLNEDGIVDAADLGFLFANWS